MEKPIIIQEDMIPAIPAKIKTTTRQVVKAADWNNAPTDTSPFRIDNLHWVWQSKDKTKSVGVVQPVQPGDILWVKEAWRPVEASSAGWCKIEYKDGAILSYDEVIGLPSKEGAWRSLLMMPRKIARYLLCVTEVTPERLQKINAIGAYDEGAVRGPHFVSYGGERCLALHSRYRDDFAAAWNRNVSDIQKGENNMQDIRAGGNTGSKMYFYCGCIFSIVGVIFIITFLLVMSHWETVAANSSGEVWLIPVTFGLLSVIMLVIGFLLLRLYSNEQKKVRRLLLRGEYVMAEITGFPINYHNRVNGIPTYFVECTYQDSTTETVHVFRSRDIGIAFLPEKITAKTVRVYVDRSSGYQDYYVDVDSILPHVTQH